MTCKFCATYSGVKIHFNFYFPLALIFHLQTKSAALGRGSGWKWEQKRYGDKFDTCLGNRHKWIAVQIHEVRINLYWETRQNTAHVLCRQPPSVRNFPKSHPQGNQVALFFRAERFKF